MPLGTYASSAAFFLLMLSVALAANDVVITVRHPLPGDIFLTSGLRPDVEVAFFPGGAIAERLRRSLGHYELCVDFDSRGAAAHIGAVSINYFCMIIVNKNVVTLATACAEIKPIRTRR